MVKYIHLFHTTSNHFQGERTGSSEQGNTVDGIMTLFSRCLIASVFLMLPNFSQAQSEAPAVPATAVSPVDPLQEIVDKAISTTSQRFLDSEVHTPWQIIHGLLALRENYVIKQGGVPVNAVEWISSGADYKGAHWFEATEDGGRAHPYNGTPYEFEGHVNQFLAVIAMSKLPLDHEFKSGSGKIVTMQEMVHHAKMNVSSLEEITWTLWFLSQYLEQDEEWINNKNEPWSMERLVRMQVKASPYDAPCGGTHGMFALAYARNAYLKEHGELRGAWLEADQKLQRYLAASQRMQNRDGSFATDWFKSTGISDEFNERIKYSGHMLEWILVSLPKERLQEQWVRVGVQTLCYDLIKNAREPSECGPLYHALHALVLYKEVTGSESSGNSIPVLASRPNGVQAGPIMNAPKPSAEAYPKPIQVQQPPVRTATQPQEIPQTRRQRRLQQRRTSSVDGDIFNGKPQEIPVLMPIFKLDYVQEVARSNDQVETTSASKAE
jgi:hypothetical protein